MTSQSGIEWTESTWNPVTGCDKVSAGCKHCYAETMARRLKAMGARGYENGFKLTCHLERVGLPLKRKKPTMYFVNSMSDLFHPDVSFDFIDQIIETINQTPQHTYQILTKRPDIMAAYFSNRSASQAARQVPANAWLGVSVENKKHGVPRIDVLRPIAAPVRFLSAEPLLEDLGEVDLTDIHWVIVGGESGAGARPMKPSWVANIKRQCRRAGVPFFFKQWGAHGADGVRRGKKANGRLYRQRVWNEMPARLP